MRRATREQWARRVERWKASGLTAAAFARRDGCNAGSLSWWSWRLKAGDRDATPSPPEAISPMTFVELATPIPREPIEIVLPSGARVRVPADFDGPALERILRALERQS